MRGRNKTAIFVNYIIAWVENPKETTNELLKLRGEFIKVTGYKINIKYYIFIHSNEHYYTNIRNTILFLMTQNNEILKCKSKKTYIGLVCWKLYHADEKHSRRSK